MESLSRYEWTDENGDQFYVDRSLPLREQTNASEYDLAYELLKLAGKDKSNRVLRNVKKTRYQDPSRFS